MGLRSASVRHPFERIMAPALTETTQTQNFKLAPKNFHNITPGINSSATFNKINKDNDELLELKHNQISYCKYSNNFSQKTASDNIDMSSPSSGDLDNVNDDKMGLTSRESVQTLQLKSNNNKNSSTTTTSSDVEQLLNNFTSELVPQNEIPDELMQVITSMDDQSNRNDEFPNDLLSFEKQLLNDVDNMMNISIEDQQQNEETIERIKETRAEDLILESQKKQMDVQRKLDFLRRRVLKIQTRLMSQHVSGEIGGVFEHVHRSLKRLKETGGENLNETTISTLSLLPTEKIDLKPMSYASSKSLIKKLETSKLIQANMVGRSKQTSKYFGAGSVEPATFRTNVSASSGSIVLPTWSPEHKQELQKIAGSLKSELRVVQSELDSEATDSSSGGESCDEFQNYNNQHQQYLSIQKRALWKYTSDRAAIAARWTWLQVQISDLEYRIRQHSELHRQVRAEKGEIMLDDVPNSTTATAVTGVAPALNGYRGQLPGSTENIESASDKPSQDDNATQPLPDYGCARTRPLIGFRKRKLLQTGGLHVISKKAARPSTVRCCCDVPNVHCALCTGRVDPTHPRDPPDVMSVAEKVAVLDPCFHPVFSMSDDVSESIHLEAIMKMSEWQQRSAKMKSLKGYNKADKTLIDNQNHHHRHRSKNMEHRKKYGRLLKPSTISALSAKIKSKIRGRKAAANRHLNRLNRKRLRTSTGNASTTSNVDGFDDEVESISGDQFGGGTNVSRSAGGSPSSSPLLQMQSISGFGRRNRISSYDIDNIVIPYSVAASTRVEKLQYKEILTPKWRIADDVKYDPKNNGTIRESDDENDNEDVTDEAVLTRHEKCEMDERKKFLSYLKMPIGYGRARSHKRTDSRAESSDTNTPDPMSPHPVESSENSKETTTTSIVNNTSTGGSPLASPPSTPLSHEDAASTSIPPSISALRRRTLSRGGFAKDKDVGKEENRCSTPTDQQDIQPYERRNFPLNENVYEEMIKSMPEDLQQVRTNVQAQDTHSDLDMSTISGTYIDRKFDSPGSESTESALIDEDPNDPEWIDVERMSRERHKR